MALPTFDKKADIPKGFEDEYEEVEGKFVPIDHTAKLQRALDEERAAREKAEGVARKAAKEAADAAARKQAAAAGMTEDELKKLYDKVEANIRAEYDPVLKEAEVLKTENRNLKLRNVVKEQFRAAGALKDKLDDFWKLHGEEFDLTADGKPMVKAEPGKDVAKHVGAICKLRNEWMQGTRAAGGGASGTSALAAAPGSGDGGALTFEDVVKRPERAISAANEQ